MWLPGKRCFCRELACRGATEREALGNLEEALPPYFDPSPTGHCHIRVT
jgi:hypothetical protein